jgi:RNA polymerase sigma factor (sigma-70 family)
LKRFFFRETLSLLGVFKRLLFMETSDGVIQRVSDDPKVGPAGYSGSSNCESKNGNRLQMQYAVDYVVPTRKTSVAFVLEGGVLRLSEFNPDDIVHEYWSLVFNRCMQLVGNRDDAEDCSIETFLRYFAWTLRSPDIATAAHERGATRLILLYFARRVCFSFLRRKKRGYVVRLEDADRELADIAARYHLKLIEFVMLLEVKDRHIIWLVHFSGMSLREICETLSCKYPTLRQRRHKAEARLRMILRRAGLTFFREYSGIERRILDSYLIDGKSKEQVCDELNVTGAEFEIVLAKWRSGSDFGIDDAFDLLDGLTSSEQIDDEESASGDSSPNKDHK